MAENSKIEWTTHTLNPWRGCTKVAPGCQHCYADDLSKRNPGTLGVWGPNGTRVVASESMWREPIKWDAAAKAAGERHRVFCASLADVFEDWPGQIKDSNGEDVCVCHGCGDWVRFIQRECSTKDCREERLPRALTIADVRDRLFGLIDATPHLDWLLLTKRPENIRRMLVPHLIENVPGHVRQNEGDGKRIRIRPNVWLGTSISDQATADRNIPLLLKCRDLSPVLFVSAEPLLGPVEIKDYTSGASIRSDNGRPLWIDWLIAGGESGHHARPMHPDWVRDLRDRCVEDEIPFLFKQWGEYGPDQVSSVRFTPVPSGIPMDEPASMFRVGKKAAGRLLDGQLWDQYPTTSVNITDSTNEKGGE